MQFINPSVLFALLAVLIPIAIHLFNFRKYKKVYFSNVSFLKTLQQKTRKQSQLLHLLVLITRILTITFLVVAFAQPYLPSSKQSLAGQKSYISIFIDNSYSMEAAGSRGKLLEDAKIKAAEIAKAYRTDDLFQLLTNDFEGKHQRLVTREEFLEMLPDVNLTPSVRSLSAIASRQQDILSGSRSNSKSAFIISDFQLSTIMSEQPDKTSDISYSLVPLKSAVVQNLYIDSCWFGNPVIQLNKNSLLNVRIRNASDSDLEKIPVKLIINDRQRAVAAINIKAGGIAEVSLPFSNNEPGMMKGVVEISDYPITNDDNYYFVFKVTDKIPVLSINSKEENPYLNSVYKLDSIISFSQVSSGKTDFSSLPAYRLIVLNDLRTVSSGSIQELTRFTKQGGSLLILPAADAEIAAVNQLLSALGTDLIEETDSARSKVIKVNNQHPVFSDVFEKSGLNADNTDLPVINSHFRLMANSKGTSETLLELGNGDPLLIQQTTGTGKVYLSTIPLNDKSGNWPRHALFVPAMLNIAFQSENLPAMMHFTGEPGAISLGSLKPAGDNIFRLSKTDGSVEFIPQYRLTDGQSQIFINDQIRDAGIFEVVSGKETVSLLAFNYNRRESDPALADDATLEKFTKGVDNFDILETGLKPLNEIIAAKNNGKSLWKWFILFSLLYIIAEVLLLRFYGKRNSPAQS